MISDEPLDEFIKNGIMELDSVKADDMLKSAALKRIARLERQDKLVAEYTRKMQFAKMKEITIKTGATLAMLLFILSAVVSVCLAKGNLALSIKLNDNESSIEQEKVLEPSLKHIFHSNSLNNSYDNKNSVPVNQSGVEYLDYFIGVWNDNQNWNTAYNINFMSVDFQVYNTFQNYIVNFNNRLKVNVVNENGEPIGRAYVDGYNYKNELVYSSFTDNQGVAYLFSNLFDSSIESQISYIEVSAQGKTVICDAQSGEVTATIDLPDATDGEKELDLMFLVSTKKSMEKQFEVLSNSLESILEMIKNENPDIEIRMSVNFYRNDDEEYILRSFPFFDDPQIAIEILKQQECSGSDDYEESFEVALNSAVLSHDWSDEAYAKLLFILYDSPPRQSQNASDLIIEATSAAARNGIRIIPITNELSDDVTVFVSRSIAVATGGTYAFFAFQEDDNDTNNTLESTVGSYRLYTFSDGIYSIISKYIE